MARYTTINEQVDRLKSLMQVTPTKPISEGFGGTVTNLAKRLLGVRSLEEKKAEVLRFIESGAHPMMTKAYNQYKMENPMKAQKYLEFYATNPNDFPKWDDTTRAFRATGQSSWLGEEEGTELKKNPRLDAIRANIPPETKEKVAQAHQQADAKFKSEPHSLNPHPEDGDDGW
jgi:hypothetical protein